MDCNVHLKVLFIVLPKTFETLLCYFCVFMYVINTLIASSQYTYALLFHSHFVNCQADNLRQQTLQQMHRILTTRQSARALLAIHDYFSRLRALSSLWLARPRE